MGQLRRDFPIFQIDAFTDRPFRGNPAAVCLLDEPQDEAWMQAVAAEMNLSETAFVVPSGNDLELRWFTPMVEVDLCGHATLAAAHALWEHAGHQGDAVFHTRSGVLTARQADGLIWLDFPVSDLTVLDPSDVPAGLIEAIDAPVQGVYLTKFDHLLLVDSAATVEAIRPDFALLGTVATRGVIVTAPGEDVDFVSRFFAPAVGVNEDPVTGSSHCALAPFWEERLGRTTFMARQLSARGGFLHVRRTGPRVQIGGQAVTVLRGSLVGE